MSDPHHRPTRRHLLGGGIAALAALPAASAFSAPALAVPVQPAAASLTDLGPALSSVNVRAVASGQLPDGRSVAYALSNGDPATLSVLDVLTGKRIFGTEIPGAELGGFVTPGPDGLIYFTCRSPMKGGLFSLDPVSFDVTLIAEDIAGQSVLYDGSFGPDGRLYVGTYPHAHVLAYDPATGEIEDYGTQTEDAAYVFGLGVVDGEVWVGTGPVPHLFRIDIASGERTELQPPTHVMEGTDWFTGIEQRGDLVFVRLSPRGTYDMAVYDQLTETWLEEIVEGTFDAAPTAVVRLNRVYYLQGDVLMGYDLRMRRTLSVGFEDSALREELSEVVGTYGIASSEELPGLPPYTVVGLNTDGVLWTYSTRRKQGSSVIADVLASPAGAHSIGTGPDGAVYMGAYLSSGVIGRIGPDTEEITRLRGPKQADTIVAHGQQLVISSYPGAVAHIGDPSAAWHWSAFDQILMLGRGAPNYQDRIFGVASVGERIALGSVPDYGQLGGALTILDPSTGDLEFHRDVVPQQSIVTLAHSDGLVYGARRAVHSPGAEHRAAVHLGRLGGGSGQCRGGGVGGEGDPGDRLRSRRPAVGAGRRGHGVRCRPHDGSGGASHRHRAALREQLGAADLPVLPHERGMPLRSRRQCPAAYRPGGGNGRGGRRRRRAVRGARGERPHLSRRGDQRLPPRGVGA